MMSGASRMSSVLSALILVSHSTTFFYGKHKNCYFRFTLEFSVQIILIDLPTFFFMEIEIVFFVARLADFDFR